jgi:hypothetical protein
MGVSLKMRKRRETGKDSASRGQRRRAARPRQTFPCFALHGYSREPLRPPHPSPKADHLAATSSFLYFERDPHGPDIHSRVGTGTTHGARHTVQGKAINVMLRSTVDRVPSAGLSREAVRRMMHSTYAQHREWFDLTHHIERVEGVEMAC